MAATSFYFALALVALIATVPLLLFVARAITAPWRALARSYPGASDGCSEEISYVTARLRGGGRALPLTRSIRIRSGGEILALSVIGLDFRAVRLDEIVIPRSAVRECTPCDLLIPRQKLVLADSTVTVVFYGRGARFVRAWWGTPAN